MNDPRIRCILGWIALTATIVLASLWLFWGAIENFHEGWYQDSFLSNVAMMFAQYLVWGLLFTGLGAMAVRWPLAGAMAFLLLAVVVPLVGIRTTAAILFVSVPLGSLGVLYLIGRPRPRVWALRLVLGLPLLVMVASGTGIAIRVAGRIADGDNSASRIIDGNGIRLLWAPEGPGWPCSSTDTLIGDWDHTQWIISRLNADGRTLSDTLVNIWRLPTVEEAVRSQVRHGRNAGGEWDPVQQEAHYRVQPDKEWPLWKDKSPIIYWWTADTARDGKAYRIVYNGLVNTLPRTTRAGYLGYRAVRNMP